MLNFGKEVTTSSAEAEKIVTAYLESQKLDMRVHERDGVCYIVTPFYRADGNRIAIEAQLVEGQGMRFADWGDTLSDARKQWLTPGHPFLATIDRIAGRFKVTLSYDEFELVSESRAGSSQLENLILAIVAVSGFIEPQCDPARTTINQFSNPGASIRKMVEEIRKAHPEPEGYVPPPPDFAKNFKHYLYGYPKDE